MFTGLHVDLWRWGPTCYSRLKLHAHVPFCSNTTFLYWLYWKVNFWYYIMVYLLDQDNVLQMTRQCFIPLWYVMYMMSQKLCGTGVSAKRPEKRNYIFILYPYSTEFLAHPFLVGSKVYFFWSPTEDYCHSLMNLICVWRWSSQCLKCWAWSDEAQMFQKCSREGKVRLGQFTHFDQCMNGIIHVITLESCQYLLS